MSNLVDNAVKYGAAGRWLGVRVDLDATRGPGAVRIAISDRGPGIPKRERVEIFEPFRRGAAVAGASAPGSGLGLAVVRSIVAAHGGQVEVGAAPGGGAVVTVRLPTAAAGLAEGGLP